MPSLCNTLNTSILKISQLSSYSNINSDDFIYIVESGSGLFSRKTTIGDLFNSGVSGVYTGSFSGSATLTGDFSGSLYGSASWADSASYALVSVATSDTSISSSYSITSSYSLSASYATAAGNSDSSLTSSHLLQDVSKVSDTSLAMWNGTYLEQSSINSLQYGYPGTTYFDISSSLGQTVQNKQGLRIFSNDNSDFWLINTRDKNSGLNTHPNMDAVFLDVSRKGAFGIKTFTGSYHMGYATPTVGGAGAGGPSAAIGGDGYFGVVPIVQQVRNNVYFWPQSGIYSTSRDGAVGIGVNYTGDLNPTGSFDQYMRAKFQIDMFSGSNEGNWAHGGSPNVEHRSTAMLIRSVSGSIDPVEVFHVSSSGDVYAKGNFTFDGQLTSSAAELTTAGGDSGLYIPIMVDGVSYKIKLYNWS
jgi:hypothetical protein